MADYFTRGQVAEAAAGIGAYASKTVAFDGLEFTGDFPSKATLSTNLTGANNDIVYTADANGGAGNDITIEYVNTGDASETLACAVSGSAITVTLATDAGTAASGKITGTDVFSNGEKITIGTVTYTMRTALTTPAVVNEVLIGASLAASLDNLKLAITAGAGAGTNYSTGTVAHPLVTATTNSDTEQTVVAKIVGTAGNTIAVSTDGANASWGSEVTALADGVNPAISSTGDEVKDIIEGTPAAAALVDVADKAANDGSGVVTVMAATNLEGGSDGVIPLFNVTGTVLMKLFATCSESLVGNTATIAIGTSVSTAGLIAQTTATDIDINEIWHDASPDASIELSTIATEKIVNQDIQALIGTAAVTDGTLTFHCIWKPLSRDGSVVAI